MSFGFALSIGRPATAAAECAVSRKIGLFVLNDGDVFFLLPDAALEGFRKTVWQIFRTAFRMFSNHLTHLRSRWLYIYITETIKAKPKRCCYNASTIGPLQFPIIINIRIIYGRLLENILTPECSVLHNIHHASCAPKRRTTESYIYCNIPQIPSSCWAR